MMVKTESKEILQIPEYLLDLSDTLVYESISINSFFESMVKDFFVLSLHNSQSFESIKEIQILQISTKLFIVS